MDVGKFLGYLKHESSIIIALFLVGGIYLVATDKQLYVGIGLLGVAALIGIIGFSVNIVRESYTGLLNQKDDLIKTLTKERRAEIKHSEELRRRVEDRSTGGWVQAGPDVDIV